MHSKPLFLFLALSALSLSGCARTGIFPAFNLTTVELSEANYQIAATSVAGEAEAAYLLGVSVSTGLATQTVALHRLRGTGFLYRDALDALWKDFEARQGEPVEGRRLGLINMRYDADITNYIVYTRVHLSIRADVVEFTD